MKSILIHRWAGGLNCGPLSPEELKREAERDAQYEAQREKSMRNANRVCNSIVGGLFFGPLGFILGLFLEP
jgi:hypothetical protein